MPVVIVHAPVHADADRLLVNVANQVAEALDLGHGDVIASQVPVACEAQSGSQLNTTPGWILITINGSPRADHAMAEAVLAAETATQRWADQMNFSLGGVMAQWLTTISPRS